MAEENEVTTERWTYCGRRWDRIDNKIVYLWRDGDGKERRFSDFRADAVGGIYEVKVTYEGERVAVKSGIIDWTGESADDRVALQAADWDAWSKKQAKARERRMSRTPEIDEVVETLLPHLRDHEDVRALASMLTVKLYDALEKRNIQRAKAK